jgi:hypothetical protein
MNWSGKSFISTALIDEAINKGDMVVKDEPPVSKDDTNH